MIKVYTGDRDQIILVGDSGHIYKDNLIKYCDYLGFMEMLNNNMSSRDLSKYVSEKYDKYLSKLEDIVKNNGKYHNKKGL